MLSRVSALLGSKLAVGDRVRLAGGYETQPRWLDGKDAYYGVVDAFIESDEGEPSALVQLDEPITFDGYQGLFAVLRLRYTGARWARNEIVHVVLCNSAPHDKTKELLAEGRWVESHANYEVVTPEA